MPACHMQNEYIVCQKLDELGTEEVLLGLDDLTFEVESGICHESILRENEDLRARVAECTAVNRELKEEVQNLSSKLMEKREKWFFFG